MKKYFLVLPLFLVLSFISCSTEEDIEFEDIEFEDIEKEDPNVVDPDTDEDGWTITDVVGKWRLDYTIERNHNGIHVGTVKEIDATEYNYVEFEFKEDNSFVETIAEGESPEDVEISKREGTYKAGWPNRYRDLMLELRYENGDWWRRKFEFNYNWTSIKIHKGRTTKRNCGCSNHIWEYEEVYIFVE